MKKHQRGFTLTELLMAIFALAWIAGLCTACYIAAHFIGKLW